MKKTIICAVLFAALASCKKSTSYVCTCSNTQTGDKIRELVIEGNDGDMILKQCNAKSTPGISCKVQ